MGKKASNSRIKKTLINTSLGVFVRISNLVCSFVLKTIFIKYLGIEYTGVSSVFSDILTVLSFAELGIGSAITFALYKPIAEKDNRQIAKYVNFYKYTYYLIAAFVFIAGFALIPFLDVIVKDVPNVKESLALIYALYIIHSASSYLLIYKSTLLTASQQSYIISLVSGLFSILRTVIGGGFIILTNNFILFLILDIALSVTHNIIVSKIADSKFSEISNYKSERLEKEEKWRILRDVKALALYKVSGTVLNGTDSIIISSMLGTSIVGYASNYTLIIISVYNLTVQFFNAITASIGNLVASRENKKQFELFVNLSFCCQFIYTLFAAGLFCLLDECVGNLWLGQDYVIDKLTVAFLCFDFYLKGNATVVNTFRNANGLFTQGQYRPIIMALLNIVISIIGVKTIGLPGVFFGTFVSRLLTQCWYDPLVLYRYAFNENVAKYYIESFVWICVLFSSTFLTTIINGLIIIDYPIISFLVHGIVCLLITVLISLLVFCKSGTLKKTITYITSSIRSIKR